MSNPVPCIQIDELHSQAICQEIGERLRIALREIPPLPAALAKLMQRLQELDHHQSPSIVPSGEHADLMFEEYAAAI